MDHETSSTLNKKDLSDVEIKRFILFDVFINCLEINAFRRAFVSRPSWSPYVSFLYPTFVPQVPQPHLHLLFRARGSPPANPVFNN